MENLMNEELLYRGFVSFILLLFTIFSIVLVGEWYSKRLSDKHDLLPPPADQTWRLRNGPRQRGLR